MTLRQRILRSDRFTAPMYRRLFAPAMLSSLGWALSDMADAVVVGQKLGTVGLAAIGLILPVYMVNCMFAHGLGLGGSVRYAHLLSQGKVQEAKESFTGVFWLSLLLSGLTVVLGNMFMTPLLGLLGTTPADGALFLATLDYLRILVSASPLFYLCNLLNYYLRNDGSERRAGLGSVVGNLCDIALNVILVFFVGMGTRGAALSTALGQIITLAIYLPGLHLKGHELHVHLPHGKWLCASLSAMRAGMATSVQYLYQTVFFLLCSNVLMRMGGETGMAVFDVIQNTSYLILYLYEGTARAMQPLISTFRGEHNAMGRHSTVVLGFSSGIAVGTALIALVEIWPMGMCMLFGISSGGAQALAVSALRIYGLGAFFAGISILLCSFFQASEQDRLSFLLETMRGAALLLPLTVLCARGGLEGFWWLFPLTEGGSLALFAGMWLICRPRMQELPDERVFQRTIVGHVADLGELCQALDEFCETWSASPTQQHFVTMTAEELGLAIMQHGFEGRSDGYLQFTVAAEMDGSFTLHLRDNAVTFNPFSLTAQRIGEDKHINMDAVGMLVIRKKAKEFYYRRYQGFNSLVVKV